MRDDDARSGELFSYVDLERRMPAGHPLRKIHAVVNAALVGIGPDLEALCSRIGRPWIAPEKLLRALLLQLFHGIRSERPMMEWLDLDLDLRRGRLFRFADSSGWAWTIGVWDASTLSKNRERLPEGEIALRFLSSIPALPRVRRLLSSDHFPVDGTLIHAWVAA